MSRAVVVVLAAATVTAFAHAPASATERVAVIGIELVKAELNPGVEKPTAVEQARLAATAAQIRQALAAAGFGVVDPARTAAALESEPPGQYLHACNGCELDYGRKLGADWVLVGWVQLVSNLIVNLNVLVKNVQTGELIASGFVDLRGNTDESWARATDYLMSNILLPRLRARR